MINFLKNILLTIVYPNRILNLFKVKNLDQNSNKILGNDLIVKMIALVLAIFFVIAARYTPPAITTYTETLYAIPLTPILDEGYTHFGSPIPSHINVILSGDRAQLDLFRAGGNNVTAYLDLDGLELGIEHDDVPIRIEGFGGQITAIAVPNVVSGIHIAENIEREFPIELATTNRELLDELDDPGSRYRYHKTLNPETVTIRGPEILLDDIVEVRAIFNATDIDLEIGESTHDAIVVVNNISGIPIIEVEVYPQIVEVTLSIYEDLKTINVEVNDNLLNLPRGYTITSITPNLDAIEVWGDFLEMDSVIELPRINFVELDNEGRITVEIPLPHNVYSETTEVEITIEYDTPPPPDADD